MFGSTRYSRWTLEELRGWRFVRHERVCVDSQISRQSCSLGIICLFVNYEGIESSLFSL